MMKAVIVSAQRSGGLLLAGCLSNHPDISCPREEIFRSESIWQKKLKMSHGDLLDFVLSQPYYKVNACRLTYDQIFNSEVAAYVKNHQVKIIHLTRSILPTVTSTLLAKQEIERGIPRHSFDGSFVDDEVLDCGPDIVIRRIKHLIRQRRIFSDRFGNGDLHLTYERLVMSESGLSEDVTFAICNLLEIPVHNLFADNRKMHRRSISSYFSKWDQIEQSIAAAFPDVVILS